MAWYVLRTKPRREEQVGAVLEQRAVEFYLPLLKRPKRVGLVRQATPFFPCYMFVSLDASSDQFLRARSAPGVVGFISFDDVPAAVPEAVVQTIRDRLDQENQARYSIPFHVGQRVRITEGPFEDVEAIFDGRVRAAGRVQVLIDLLGKQWRVQVNLKQLTKAS